MNYLYYLKNPKTLFKKTLAKFTLSLVKKKFKFKNKGLFLTRQYNEYSDYLKHQKSKFIINERILKEVFEKKTENFFLSFKKITDFNKKNVLCLASRDGAEVKAFRDLGANAVGIDLMYPEKCKYVHYGDFHDIPYPKNVFDFVFTNSLDHAFDIDKISEEANRVLKKDGFFLCDIVLGTEEGYKDLSGDFESFTWSKRSDLKDIITKKYFTFDNEIKKDKYWSHFLFKPIK